MNKTACINGKVGDLLHAYELGILSPEEADKFEVHLLDCEYCAQKVAAFGRQAEILRSGRQVAEEIAEQAAEVADVTGEASGMWARFWPTGSPFLKPGLLLLIILILLIPAYRGMFIAKSPQIGPPQVVNLVPFRDSEPECFDRSRRGDGLLTFVYPGAATGKPYIIQIGSESGEIIFADSSYAAFDEYGTGRLLFPAKLMKPGRYKLLISSEGAPGNSREYAFCVRE
jgi:hypothetical protein